MSPPPGSKARQQLVYGFHPVRELLRHRPQEVEEVLIAARPGKRRSEVEGLCRRHRIAFTSSARGHLDQLVDSTRHNGFVARSRESAGTAPAPGDPDLVVLLEDVQDPRNLGALLRVCEGAGVGRVLIRDRGSAPLTPVAVKASAGAAEWLEIERIVNPAQQIEALQEEGFWVYGADADGDPPWEIDLRGRVAICLGGEGKGLRSLTRRRCDRLVGLPMRGRVESLNVATAAAALLYEALRQRLDPSAGTTLAHPEESKVQ